MNLVLLDSEATNSLRAGTHAAEHLLRVLKISVGSVFWCGAKNGARGLATVREISADGDVRFSVAWERDFRCALPPVTLVVGLSRPQTMKKIFAAAAEIGCARIEVFRSEKGDPAYAESSLWKRGDATLAEILEKAAEQTCVPALPEFALRESLASALDAVPAEAARIALDIYDAETSLASVPALAPGASVALAVGSERGWSPREREILRARNFSVAHLGERVLRVETAVSVALAVALARIDFWTPHRVLRAAL